MGFLSYVFQSIFEFKSSLSMSSFKNDPYEKNSSEAQFICRFTMWYNKEYMVIIGKWTLKPDCILESKF